MDKSRWTKSEAFACAYCWAEFFAPEMRTDTPEEHWRCVTERTRQECRKIVKDRYLLAVASREAAPLFRPDNLSEEQMQAVQAAIGLKARHRVWGILQAVHRVFLPPARGKADRAIIDAEVDAN